MRIRTLITKEFLDVARNRAVLLPVVLVTVMSLVLPFVIAVLMPALTGRGLGEDADLVKVSAVAGVDTDLSNDARVQLFLFQQFLMLFLLTPITGAMALAAHAIVGEKQARTLEPLLATPGHHVRAAHGQGARRADPDARDFADRPGPLRPAASWCSPNRASPGRCRARGR